MRSSPSVFNIARPRPERINLEPLEIDEAFPAVVAVDSSAARAAMTPVIPRMDGRQGGRPH